MTIREIKPSEIYKLEDMLYEAICQPDEDNLIPRTVLDIPEVNAYIRDFGSRKDDYCIVADSDGEIIGAVWLRIISDEIKGYGYIDDETSCHFTIQRISQSRDWNTVNVCNDRIFARKWLQTNFLER